jgi:hypothetical protein
MLNRSFYPSDSAGASRRGQPPSLLLIGLDIRLIRDIGGMSAVLEGAGNDFKRLVSLV